MSPLTIVASTLLATLSPQVMTTVIVIGVAGFFLYAAAKLISEIKDWL